MSDGVTKRRNGLLKQASNFLIKTEYNDYWKDTNDYKRVQYRFMDYDDIQFSTDQNSTAMRLKIALIGCHCPDGCWQRGLLHKKENAYGSP